MARERAGEDGLTERQRLFVQAYTGRALGNATEAARLAGYADPNVQGPRLLLVNVGNSAVREAIKVRLAELAMPDDEILARLAEHARGDAGDFIGGEGGVDPMSGNTRLIKKLSRRSRRYQVAQGEYETETTWDIELYSAQTALETLAEISRLKTKNVNLTHSGSVGTYTAEQLAQLPVEELRRLREETLRNGGAGGK